jgi:hypothetical protein
MFWRIPANGLTKDFLFLAMATILYSVAERARDMHNVLCCQQFDQWKPDKIFYL